jgi:hypothetical protein
MKNQCLPSENQSTKIFVSETLFAAYVWKLTADDFIKGARENINSDCAEKNCPCYFCNFPHNYSNELAWALDRENATIHNSLTDAYEAYIGDSFPRRAIVEMLMDSNRDSISVQKTNRTKDVV